MSDCLRSMFGMYLTYAPLYLCHVSCIKIKYTVFSDIIAVYMQHVKNLKL